MHIMTNFAPESANPSPCQREGVRWGVLSFLLVPVPSSTEESTAEDGDSNV